METEGLDQGIDDQVVAEFIPVFGARVRRGGWARLATKAGWRYTVLVSNEDAAFPADIEICHRSSGTLAGKFTIEPGRSHAVRVEMTHDGVRVYNVTKKGKVENPVVQASLYSA